MSYVDFFGMQMEPFSNAPDMRFYFKSEQQKDALAKLRYCIDSNKGLAVLIGAVGIGKTTLARHLLDSLPEEKYESSLLVMIHSGVTAEWILTRIAIQLGVENPANDRLVLLKQLYDRLVQIGEEGRQAVVLIDEAQMLQSRELMEEFRGLLNLEVPGKKLLNIIFFGLPDITESLRLDKPLAQRVAIRFHLETFSEDITTIYIRHRLQVAGASRMFFQPPALKAIHKFSGGLPRLINTLCDNAMFEAFMRKTQDVSFQIVHTVAGELGFLQQDEEEPAPQDKFSDLNEIENLLDRLEQKV